MSIIEKAVEKLRQAPAASVAEAVVKPQDDSAGADISVSPAAAVDVPVGSALPDSEGRGKVSNRVTLDVERLERAGIVTPESARTQLAEELRHIKRPLLLNVAGKGATVAENANLIMVTSSRPGEGKTFTSLNLAMSIAKERDRTVLLVDADVAKPSITRLLGINANAGLVDYLIDDSLELSDVLLKTNVPSFRVLPAGRRHIHSTELLASEAMRKLTHELSSRYPDRIVIFDSPPLLATSEAAVLAGLVGQIVMVVEAERTTKQELTDALALINPESIVGMVLNKSRGNFGADYYYGYYGAYGE